MLCSRSAQAAAVRDVQARRDERLLDLIITHILRITLHTQEEESHVTVGNSRQKIAATTLQPHQMIRTYVCCWGTALRDGSCFHCLYPHRFHNNKTALHYSFPCECVRGTPSEGCGSVMMKCVAV